MEATSSSRFGSARSFWSGQPGRQIGPYKLLQVIGEGGMGAVYMAEQTEPVKRRVALKLIKPGMDSSEVIARFDAERQALAMMDHPNVAKVLDAGTSDGGRPYFVMELVKGVPITAYCDEHRLSFRQRLELFVDVCRGVQHAHQKGIIHRDLKPSNILVAEYDHQPVVKIIDFGVAKATAHELTAKTLFTQFGQIVGTLDYMSPEQAKFNQLDIDTRSDIYSLGVVLYELLAGSTPIDKDRLRKSGLEEILRVIREEVPPRPSTRLSSSATLPALAVSRSTEPGKLRGQLREDLDWIVIKAMDKERSTRYQTAESLAADIENHLDDRPIQARRPTVAGKIRRFARRNRFAVGMSSLVIAASLIAVAFGLFARLAQVKQKEREAELAASQVERERIELQSRENKFAREVALPRIRQLIADYRPVEAFLLANDIQQTLTHDPEYQQLREEMTVTVSFQVKPAGTTVSYRDARNPEGQWVPAGETPLIDIELPRGDLRFRYSCDGYVTHEFQRKFPEFLMYDGGATMSLRKLPETDDGMVQISNVTAASWNRLPVDLSPFRIDRYEVSNAEYQEFVHAGGYADAKYWSGIEFERDGETILWEEAITEFIDSTGKPGPAFWKDGAFPEGEDDYPVVGISWFEAVAYAAYRKKSLPTVHHWRWAANTDQPGLMSALSNFSQEGLSPRGTWDGIGRFEVYDLAGNVKEWCLNERETENRCLCGGAWNEPEYKFSFTDSASPWSREETFGFRCVQYGKNAPEDLALAPLPQLPPQLHNLKRQPIEVLTDRGLRFANDNVPFDAEVTQTEAPNPSPDFRHEVIRITAGYDNERFDIHLLVPRKGEPPFETVVWSPGMGVWARTEKFPSALEAQDNQYIAPLARSGRIVCQPIYKGTFERSKGIAILKQFQKNPIQARADFIKVIKDLSRTVDYLVTRRDVDPDRLVYFGLSLSASQGPIGLVAEPEFDAAVLLSGGYTQRIGKITGASWVSVRSARRQSPY